MAATSLTRHLLPDQSFSLVHQPHPCQLHWLQTPLSLGKDEGKPKDALLKPLYANNT